MVRYAYFNGSTHYAATNNGLSISTDGTTFTNKTIANGLGSNFLFDVIATGTTVYAATYGGLSISTNGGVTFINKTTANGLGSNYISDVYVVGSTVYAATQPVWNGTGYVGGGLSVSIDGGAIFNNYATIRGLGSNFVYSVFYTP